MGLAVDIVKHNRLKGHEQFSRDKLHASIVAACLSVRTPVGQAESIAHAVSNSVVDWLENKPEVTSQDLREVASKHLESHHPEAAYIYRQYRITI